MQGSRDFYQKVAQFLNILLSNFYDNSRDPLEKDSQTKVAWLQTQTLAIASGISLFINLVLSQ